MILQEGSLQFDFDDALNAFKFDEQNIALPTFHGLSHCMKAVDFIVEYEDCYLFVEIKNPTDPNRYGPEQDKNKLIQNLVDKFRDTFIYRWAESKLEKPVRYQCLIELDNPQTLHLMKLLKQQLPTEKQPARWQQPLVQLCAVANMATWNKTFPNIKVTRVAGGAA